MRATKFFAILIILIMCFSTCTDNDPVATSSGKNKPEPTPIGNVTGESVVELIGADGGSITSIDGKATLHIPAGALSANTNISVQPITNLAPGGTAGGYRFGPDGTKFNKPVTLTIQYTDNDIAGTLPMLMGIAFQDEDGIWYSLRNFKLATTSKEISTTISHFTDYAFFVSLRISPNSAEMKVAEKQLFDVMSVEEDDDDLQSLVPGGDELIPLNKIHPVDPDLIKSWAVNGLKDGGDGEYGSVAQSGSNCTYTAPVVKPHGSKNPVQLSVEIKAKFTDPSTKVSFDRLTLVAPVHIVGDFKYDLVIMYYTNTQFTGGLVGAAFIVKDSASLRLELKNGSVVPSDINNVAGDVIPTTKTDDYGNKSTWIPPDDAFVGPINVTGCTGTYSISPTPELPNTIILSVEGTSDAPAFNWVSAFGDKLSIPGGSGKLNLLMFMDLKDSIPTWNSGDEDRIVAKLHRVD